MSVAPLLCMKLLRRELEKLRSQKLAVRQNQQPSLLDYKPPAPALLVKMELNSSELQQGSFIGMQRHNYAIYKGLRQRKGYKNPWDNVIEGALAEMAFAKLMNIYWDGKINKLTKGDVGFWEVRQTKHTDGCLRIAPTDNNDAPYVLLTGQNGVYFVRGWMMGIEGKQQKYWRKMSDQGRYNFWVPQSDLLPIETHEDYPTAHQGVTI